jgi:hypothetical protein
MKESIETYNEFYRFLHVVKNCKILLLSGTPIQDSIEEIADVMNLILPIKTKLPTGKDFINKFFTKQDNFFQINAKKAEELKSYFKGRVSYLGSPDTQIKKVFIGDKTGSLQYFKVYTDIMSDFQAKYYSKTFGKVVEETENADEEVKNSIYNNSRQAALFVFPDGKYGKDGFKKYIISKSNNTYSLNDELGKALSVNNDDERQRQRLEKLYKYSSKFAKCIENILKATKEGKLSFVFCSYIHGSGGILFSLILRLFGFSKATGEDLTKGKRYAIVNSEMSSAKEIKDIINKYNDPSNRHGEYISVLIGSNVISEGFTLKNVQEEHILTGHWNYSETAQVIARGYRLNSHEDLLNEGLVPVLSVYLYVSMPNPDGEYRDVESIDLKLYEFSEVKDVNIKHVERLIQESAFDCALDYKRNYKPGYDYQRECNYAKCEYKCDGIESLDVSEKELDYSTYNLYYNQLNVKNAVNDIIELFKTRFNLNFKNIKNILNMYSVYDLLTALNDIIVKQHIVTNKYGFSCYIMHENNNYFLVNNLGDNKNYLSEFYVANQIVRETSDFKTILDKDLYSQNIPEIIEALFKLENEEEIKKVIESLPLKIQNILLENSITALENGINVNDLQRDVILNNLKKYAKKVGNDLWISFLLKDNDVIRCSRIETGFKEWGACSEDEKTIYNETTKEDILSFEDNEYGLYGIVEGNKFKIKENVYEETFKKGKPGEKDKRKELKGKVCGSYSKGALVDIVINKLRIDTPTDDDKNTNIWQKRSKESETDLKNKIKKAMLKDPVITLDIDNINKEQALYYQYIYEKSKEELCGKIKNFLESKGLVMYINKKNDI